MSAIIQYDERKTNERAGVRAVHRGARMSAYKAREVLDLIRNKSVAEARTILQFCDRGAAEEVTKVLDSAVANAGNNNDIPPEELFVTSCYADEGPTMKRWRPRARGRATRIRKRTCHITIIVGRYTQTELDGIRDRLAAKGQTAASPSAERARRVARSRSKASAAAVEDTTEDTLEVGTPDSESPEVESPEVEATDVPVEEETDLEATGTDESGADDPVESEEAVDTETEEKDD